MSCLNRIEPGFGLRPPSYPTYSLQHLLLCVCDPSPPRLAVPAVRPLPPLPPPLAGCVAATSHTSNIMSIMVYLYLKGHLGENSKSALLHLAIPNDTLAA
jgi:hypothetical protein